MFLGLHNYVSRDNVRIDDPAMNELIEYVNFVTSCEKPSMWAEKHTLILEMESSVYLSIINIVVTEVMESHLATQYNAL